MKSFSEFFDEIIESHEPVEVPALWHGPEFVPCSRCYHYPAMVALAGVCVECAATCERGYEIHRLAGRCANGFEADGGSLFHARPLADHGWGQEKALCGASPGRRSAGWSLYPGDAVTCKRCLKKLEAR